MKIVKTILLTSVTLAFTACGGDKAEESAATKSMDAGRSEEAMAAPMAMSEEYGVTIDHSRDVAEFELRRSIAGLDRMIEQYTADGHATDELSAQKAELSASLDKVMM